MRGALKKFGMSFEMSFCYVRCYDPKLTEPVAISSVFEGPELLPQLMKILFQATACIFILKAWMGIVTF